MPNIFKQIVRTVEGKTGIGRALHQLLPAKSLRSLIGNVVFGLKKASPLPEVKDPAVREQVEEAYQELNTLTGSGDNLSQATQLKDKEEGEILKTIQKVRDILDDGRLNSSPDDLSPQTKKIIQQSMSALPLVAYLVYAITTGDFSLSGFLEYVQLFFGL